MDQPHVPVDSLLQQMEEYRLRREVRDARPDPITTFISDVAELFEPFYGVGRVGFDCQAAAQDWVISLYLGSTEVVGGREDGLHQNPAFHFDVHTAMSMFTSLESVRFTSHPALSGESDNFGVTLVGSVDRYPVRLIVHGTPPLESTPAMQRMPDRTLRLT